MAVDIEQVEMLLMESEEKMEKTVSVLKEEYIQLRIGRANPHVLDKVLVDYYGEMTPINQTANISVQDGKCLVISPWDKSLIKNMEKGITIANIGLTPSNDGNVIRLVFPDLTQERRKEIVKQVKKMAEDSKIAIRNVRRDATDAVKKLEKAENLPEDAVKDGQDQVQKITDKYTKIVDETVSVKEKEVMEI